jgi:proteasome assembly chaperone (PAC2) family protein
VITIGGDLQPMTAAGQFEVADTILKLAKVSKSPQVLILAGLAAGTEDRGIHVICADEKVRKNLESNDILVSRTQPEAGMIGLAGLLISLSPLHEVPAVALVAETIGASMDVLAADRLANWIEEGLNLPLDLDLDTTEETAKKLLASMEISGSIEDTLADVEHISESNFYA